MKHEMEMILMKCLAVGDLFIPEDIMVKSFENNNFTDVKALFWGSRDKQEMRNKVKNLETGGPTAENPPSDIKSLIQDVEILMIHLCPIPNEVIQSAKKLKVIASTRGGVENVDVASATEKGIAVISTPSHNAQAVAEFTIGLIISETRNIARAHAALKNGIWREAYPNSGSVPEVNGSTIGLVGYGTIGKLIVEKLKGFDVNIMVYDPYVPQNAIIADKCIPADLDTLLKESDVISMHARVSKDGKPIIADREFSLMKPTAYFINTARANVVDMKALRRVLTEKRILGAALDVYDYEPISSDDPLISLDNVTLTNHRGGDTLNSYWKSPDIVLRQTMKYFNGEMPHLLANPQVFPHIKKEMPA